MLDQLLEEAGLAYHDNAKEALIEQIRAERARRSLLHFTKYTFSLYVDDPVHGLIASYLDRIVSGELKRLMIFAPPQSGKSELASVRLPAFWLGHRPNDPIILSSYGASLAHTKSRHARAVVESSEYERIFPIVATSRARRAVDHWELEPPHRGSMLAAGVGGPITGHGAMLGIIDDPFENWERAQSQTTRDRVWEWWRGTFRPRVWEGGSVVLIMTRWHTDDLAGRLLDMEGDRWEVLRLPALAETQEERDIVNERMGLPSGLADPLNRIPGEALCPQRFSKEAMESTKIEVGSRVWGSQYQGAPTIPEGNRFKRSWFEIVDISPAKGERVRYWDKGATAGSGSYTAGTLMLRADNTYFIEDVVRGQWSSGERNRIIKQTAIADKEKYGNTVQIWVEQEGGSGGKESAEFTIKDLAGFNIYAEMVTGSKDVRLEPFAAQAEALNVKLVRGPWNRDFIEEIITIPNTTVRDQSDSAGGAFNKLAEGTAQLVIISTRLRRAIGV